MVDLWSDEARELSWPEWMTRLDSSKMTLCKAGFVDGDVDFAEMLAEIAPRLVIELGTGYGVLSAVIQRAMAPGGTLVTLDLKQQNPPTVNVAARLDIGVHVLEGSSIDLVVQAAARLGGAPDFVFIDTDHTAGLTQREVELYAPLIASGGWLGFHDTLTQVDGFGVREVFDAFATGKHSEEFTTHQGYGMVQIP